MSYEIQVGAERLQGAVLAFLSHYQTTAERTAAVQAALESPAGPLWREQLAQWTTQVVPVEELVPEVYSHWRPLVHDAMQFVVSRLSPARLAPKVVEQMELAPEMPAEVRLLRLITRVPGLQKIGQVVARNRHLPPRFRRSLSQLENSICDVSREQIRTLIFTELGPRIARFRVRVAANIFSEASVSAVVRFTWHNPESGRREQGVFKVLKPHIPGCFAEDMAILQRLAGYLARRHRQDRSRFAGLAETLTEIRLLLAHEVDFRREQVTLANALGAYRSLAGVRVPRLIAPLCTDTITALAYESGVKVTRVWAQRPSARERVAERLAEALLAVPALDRHPEVVFHADPHAGNLLYDPRRDELVILDWALAERLTREQRRQVMLLALMLMLRDADGACRAVARLRQHRPGDEQQAGKIVREQVARILAALPLCRLPGPMDALHLLDELAREGIRFPVPLVMFRKGAFTLDGVLEDVAGRSIRMDSAVLRYALRHWPATAAALFSLLSPGDWLALEWSALTLIARLGAQALQGTPQSACVPA